MIGRNLNITQSMGGLPQVTSALIGWEVSITANFVQQEIVDGDIVETSIIKKMSGVLQPLKTEQIALKPEGQRSWDWYWLHVKPEYDKLRTEQIIEINGISYRIIAIKNYELYGYIEYQCVRDFSGA